MASKGFVALFLGVAAVLVVVLLRPVEAEDPQPQPPKSEEKKPEEKIAVKTPDYSKPSADEIKKKLSPIQFRVTQMDGTEPPFQNEFWNNKEAGLYVDIVTGEPLFSSKDKFDSGTGWPSFTKPVVAKNVIEKTDSSHGMRRVEVRSLAGNSHLGHVFDDGPKAAGGMRYCINSASLRFIPLEKLEAEGYGYLREQVAAKPGEVALGKSAAVVCEPGAMPAGLACEATMEVAVLAGGCFWGMEDILRKVDGVIDTDVGYTGGETEKPTYNDVKNGRSGHAEAIKIVFDPKKISYADILEKWFFKMHDPTTRNRQGNDVGTQYRSAIFYVSDAQKKTAEEVKARVDASGKWKRPIVTEIVKAGAFTNAEGYHQDYLVKNPGGYTCHYMRD